MYNSFIVCKDRQWSANKKKKRLKRIKHTLFVLKRIYGGVIVNYKYADSGLLLWWDGLFFVGQTERLLKSVGSVESFSIVFFVHFLYSL